jgi:hypothetical protein
LTVIIIFQQGIVIRGGRAVPFRAAVRTAIDKRTDL